MAQTPYSTLTPYCSAEDLFVYHDPNQIADMLRAGGDPRPTLADMLNASSAVGTVLRRFLLSAAGRIESTAIVGKRYSPDDLNGLLGTGSGAEQMLIKLNADVAFWQICQRRQPNASDPKNVPGATEAFEYLKQLALGETIFGFEESADAGLPSVVPPAPANLLTPNVVGRARRIFPGVSLNNILGTSGNTGADG